MGVYDKIDKVSANGKTPYILPGVYKLEVLACKSIETRSRDDLFIVEFEVKESNNPERPVGSVMSWTVKLDPAYLESSLANIKSFMQKALQNADITSKDVEDATGEENPLAGVQIKANAYNEKTKANKDFTKVTWLDCE